MMPPDNILSLWKKFDDFSMETLTKAWFYHKGTVKKQREVSLMKEHRLQYGLAGNCFDLTLWLLDEFHKVGVTAYPIGHNIHNENAHVAVIALDEFGCRYLCDLGDQWLTPVLVDKDCENYTDMKLIGFFPGATVQVKPNNSFIEILYHRVNGKVSKQIYDSQPIEMDDFLRAAEHCQSLINPHPLFECRIPYKSETAHWEFYNWASFLSTTEGLYTEFKLDTIEGWAERIHQKSGYDKRFLVNVLKIYDSMKSK